MSIRNYSRFAVPRGLKATLLRKLAAMDAASTRRWQQYTFDELLNDGAEMWRTLLRDAINRAAGTKFGLSKLDFIVHTGSSDVPAHRDGMASTVFLVPLVCTPTQKFYVKYTKQRLAPGALLRFNDHESHGITNPNGARFVVVSVSNQTY